MLTVKGASQQVQGRGGILQGHPGNASEHQGEHKEAENCAECSRHDIVDGERQRQSDEGVVQEEPENLEGLAIE